MAKTKGVPRCFKDVLIIPENSRYVLGELGKLISSPKTGMTF